MDAKGCLEETPPVGSRAHRSRREILAAAAELNECSELVALHPRDAAFTTPWHRAIEAMYPTEWQAVVIALRDGAPWAIDPAIDFVDADPRCFRSGYEKERLCRYLGRIDLEEAQRIRVAVVARRVLDGPPRPDRELRRWRLLLAAAGGAISP
jgi:hypothetical protein